MGCRFVGRCAFGGQGKEIHLLTNTATDASGNIAACTFDITVLANQNPVFSSLTVTTMSNRAVSIHRIKLLGHASDPDGDPLDIVGVGALSTNGAPVAWDGTNATYTALAGFVGFDLFSVTVADNRGGSVDGPVVVKVVAEPEGFNRICLVATNGGYLLTYGGIPGYAYQVQRSTNMVSWDVIATRTIDGHGQMQYFDVSPPPESAFYRTAAP